MEQENVVKFDRARFTILTENLIRIEYSETGQFEERATQIVQNRNFPSVKFDKIEKGGSIEILTDALHLYYRGGAFDKATLFADVKFNFSVYSNRWYFGQKTEGNLGGTTRTLDGVDGVCPLDDGIMSQNGFAVLVDDSLPLNEAGDIAGASCDEVDLYFFAYGREFRRALQDYYRLTGAVPLLPRWALGNWWSRYYEYSADSYLALMDKFEAKKVPLSVSVIDMDWHRVADVPSHFGSGWTGYSWNSELFPEPEKFLAELHRRKLKITLNDHPADGVRAFETNYPEIAKRLQLDEKLEEPATFDFDNPDFRAGYFGDIHRPLEDQGVNFWWLDWQQGSVSSSGADPLWLLNHYQYQDAQKKHENNIILSRYAGPGSHRYPLGFSGDTVVSWDSLNFQPYFTATATNIGYTWWSHDIGGHMKGIKDAELELRWFQYGVFSPINRLHSSKSEFTSKEPWHFDAVTEKGMIEFLQLRHALIPYLETANRRTASEGRALVEPLYYEWPDRDEAYQQPNEYLFGSEFLVAPITQKADSTLQMGAVEVWLPEGTWYDFFTGQRYQGGVTLKIFRELTQMPVFVRAGAIVPLDKNPLFKEEIPSEIVWQIFPGAANDYTLLEETGRTSVKFDGKYLTLHEENPSQRRHKIVYAGHEVASDLTGDFTLDLSNLTETFDWDFKAQLFRRLDIAELAYEDKDKIYQTLSNLTDFNKQVAYLKQLPNSDLQDSLFEIIYSKL